MNRSSTLALNSIPEHSLQGVSLLALGIIAGVLAAFGQWAYAAGAVALLCVVRWPIQFTFGVYAFLIPFDNVSAVGGESSGATLTRYLSFAVILVLLSVGLASRRLSTPPRAALWWSLFVFWGVLTFGWAVDQQAVLERLPTVLSLLLLFLVASSFRFTSEELSAVATMVVLGGCAGALFATGGFFGGQSFHGTGRSSLLIGERETDPNFFSASLLLPLSLAFGALIQSRHRLIRAGALVAIVFLGLAQLLTMSRGGVLALGAMILVYVYRLKINRRIVLAAACLMLLAAFMPQSFFERLALADKGGPRVDIWTASLGLLPHYGFFGAGLNNFAVAYYSVAGDAPTFQGLNRASHSVYLGMSVELGIAGLVFLILAFREQLRGRYNAFVLPYQAACWGMLAAGLTLDVVFRKFFWLCWILLAIATRLADASSPPSGPEYRTSHQGNSHHFARV